MHKCLFPEEKCDNRYAGSPWKCNNDPRNGLCKNTFKIPCQKLLRGRTIAEAVKIMDEMLCKKTTTKK